MLFQVKLNFEFPANFPCCLQTNIQLLTRSKVAPNSNRNITIVSQKMQLVQLSFKAEIGVNFRKSHYVHAWLQVFSSTTPYFVNDILLSAYYLRVQNKRSFCSRSYLLQRRRVFSLALLPFLLSLKRQNALLFQGFKRRASFLSRAPFTLAYNGTNW